MDPKDLRTMAPAVEAHVISELGRMAAASGLTPRTGTYKDAAQFVVLRDGDGAERLEWLTQRLTDPERKFGTVNLNDAKSFIEFFKVHGTEKGPIFASMKPAAFIAVLNDNTQNKAGWRDHRAVYQVAHSREWETWSKHNGAGAAFNSNTSFAMFLEENALDVVKPDAAVMLSLALNFRVRADVTFSVAQRLEDGHVELGYNNLVSGSSQTAAGGKMKIPEQFTIEVPVWDGLDAKRYKVDARFRYRLAEGGKLTIWYELVRPHKVVEQAFKDLWQQIEKDTKATIFHGKPE